LENTTEPTLSDPIRCVNVDHDQIEAATALRESRFTISAQVDPAEMHCLVLPVVAVHRFVPLSATNRTERPTTGPPVSVRSTFAVRVRM
jgi:hypothetical protein